jgi:hypothetical protein
MEIRHWWTIYLDDGSIVQREALLNKPNATKEEIFSYLRDGQKATHAILTRLVNEEIRRVEAGNDGPAEADKEANDCKDWGKQCTLRVKAKKQNLIAHKRKGKWYFADQRNYLQSTKQGLTLEEAYDYLQQPD